jgi:hypothetical protein
MQSSAGRITAFISCYCRQRDGGNKGRSVVMSRNRNNRDNNNSGRGVRRRPTSCAYRFLGCLAFERRQFATARERFVHKQVTNDRFQCKKRSLSANFAVHVRRRHRFLRYIVVVVVAADAAPRNRTRDRFAPVIRDLWFLTIEEIEQCY